MKKRTRPKQNTQTHDPQDQADDTQLDTSDLSQEPAPIEQQSSTEKQRSALVIGLGLYGSTLAIELTHLGWFVLAVDTDAETTEKLASKVSGVRVIDANDHQAIESLDPSRFDVCICAMGEESVQALTFTIFNLKECKARRVISRSVNEKHHDLFKKLGADLVVNPEKGFALSLSHSLHNHGVDSLMPISTTHESALPIGDLISPASIKDETPKAISDKPRRFFQIIKLMAIQLVVMGILLFVITAQNIELRSLKTHREWYQSELFLSGIVIIIMTWIIRQVVIDQGRMER